MKSDNGVNNSYFFPHTVNLLSASEHQSTTTSSVMIQWASSLLSLGSRGNLDWWTWKMQPSLGSTPGDLHFRKCSLLPVRVFWIFCVEFFKGLFRSLGTKTRLLTLPPTLNVQSALVHANNSKFPKESTSTPKSTYSSGHSRWPPQMPLVYSEQTVQPWEPTQVSITKEAETVHNQETTRSSSSSGTLLNQCRNPCT